MMKAASPQKTLQPLVERRGLARLKVSAMLQFRNVLKPSEPFAGSLSKDLSIGGVSLATRLFLPKDLRLVVLLSLPGLPKAIRTIGRVAWASDQKFSDHFDCGIQFIEMIPEDRSTIASYVERGVTAPPAPFDRGAYLTGPTGSRDLAPA